MRFIFVNRYVFLDINYFIFDIKNNELKQFGLFVLYISREACKIMQYFHIYMQRLRCETFSKFLHNNSGFWGQNCIKRAILMNFFLKVLVFIE